MYSEGRISIDRLKAAAKSVPKLLKRWNRSSYFDDDMNSELPPPCIKDILEMDTAADLIGVTSYTSLPKPNAPATKEMKGHEEQPDHCLIKPAKSPSKSSPGIDIEAWLQQVDQSPPPTPSVTPAINNATLPPQSTMDDFFEGLKREMERL